MDDRAQNPAVSILIASAIDDFTYKLHSVLMFCSVTLVWLTRPRLQHKGELVQSGRVAQKGHFLSAASKFQICQDQIQNEKALNWIPNTAKKDTGQIVNMILPNASKGVHPEYAWTTVYIAGRASTSPPPVRIYRNEYLLHHYPPFGQATTLAEFLGGREMDIIERYRA